jgi:DNA repair protein RadC
MKDDKPGPSISGPDDVCRLMRDAKDLDRESFYVLYLDTKNRIAGVEEAHRGTVTHVDVHPREVFKGALASNATAIIAVHNHPSGDSTPSDQDYALTSRLVNAGQILGIPMLDHIVVGDQDCSSIRERSPASFSGVKTLKKGK